MLKIAELDYGAPPKTNACFEFQAFRREFEVQRFGFDGQIASLLRVLLSLRNQVDAFALSGLPSGFRVNDRAYVHPDRSRLLNLPSSVPVCDGHPLAALCTISRLDEELAAGRIDVSKGCFFPLLSNHSEAFRVLGEVDPERVMAGDLYPLLGINQILRYGSLQAQLLPWGLTLNSALGLKRGHATGAWKLPAASEFEYVYTAPDSLSLLTTDLRALFDKKWILASCDPHLDNRIAEFSPKEVIRLFPEALKFGPSVSYSIVDAAMRLSLARRSPLSLDEWAEKLADLAPLRKGTPTDVGGARPSIQSWWHRAAQSVAKTVGKAAGGGPRGADPEFAFILHPLSHRQVFEIPGLRALGKRLHEVAREIGEIAPDCDLVVSTSADDWAASADVIVTATSSRGQRVVDVGRLKPGAVVCDCSRPLDFTIEDAMARPDVLIIESGEVLLPGPATLDCYIGLSDRAVWACLGETALLALAERYEAFSLGRGLDWRRVKEIYRLAREHGVDLAGIRGHAGVITDREIVLTRELALKGRRAEQ